MYKIITVCGLGVGSSLILKMTVDSAMNALGIEADIEHWDMGTVSSKPCDFIVTTTQFKKELSQYNNVVYVDNIVDVEESKTKIKEYLDSINK